MALGNVFVKTAVEDSDFIFYCYDYQDDHKYLIDSRIRLRYNIMSGDALPTLGATIAYHSNGRFC